MSLFKILARSRQASSRPTAPHTNRESELSLHPLLQVFVRVQSIAGLVMPKHLLSVQSISQERIVSITDVKWKEGTFLRLEFHYREQPIGHAIAETRLTTESEISIFVDWDLTKGLEKPITPFQLHQLGAKISIHHRTKANRSEASSITVYPSSAADQASTPPLDELERPDLQLEAIGSPSP